MTCGWIPFWDAWNDVRFPVMSLFSNYWRTWCIPTSPTMQMMGWTAWILAKQKAIHTLWQAGNRVCFWIWIVRATKVPPRYKLQRIVHIDMALISRGQPVGPAPMPPGDRGYHRLWDSRDLAETFPVGIGFLGLQLHLWHGPFGGQHQGKTHPKSIQKLFFSRIVSVR